MTPSIYQQITQKLRQAKTEDSRPQDAINAIIYLSDALAKIALDKTLSSAVLGEFIADEQMLFPTDTEIARPGQADYRLITSGLISQTLEAAGVVEHRSLAKQLQQAIYDLDSTLARRKSDASERDNLVDAADTLHLAVK